MGIARRLRENIRGDDVAARLGGDEFTILIPSISSYAMADQFAARLIDSLRGPLKVNDHVLRVTTSIGICVAEKSATDRQELLRSADTALYQAKRRGRNAYVMYEPGLDAPSDVEMDRTLNPPEEQSVVATFQGVSGAMSSRY